MKIRSPFADSGGFAQKIGAKDLLLFLYLAGNYSVIAERIVSLGLSAPLFFYLPLLFLVAACLFFAANVENWALRIFYAILFAASSFYLDSYHSITREHLTYDAFINLLNSAGFAGDALQQHAGTIARSALLGLLLLVGIALRPISRLPLPKRIVAAAPVAGLALLTGILFVRGGEGARGLPGAFTPIAYAGIYLYDNGGTPAARQKVTLQPGPGAKPRDIVLIVDESVAANYLDIANPAGVRSGLNEARAGAAIYNYGYAASINNCSLGTNLTLRYGGTRKEYQRINATMPSIWDYARRAGLRTVYIDSQRTGGALQNMMSEDERKAIDSFIQFDSVPVRDRDQAAADTIAALLDNDTAEFIFVNKVGAHFPINDKYPDSFLRHSPALPRGGYGDVSDTGSREGFSGDAEDWRKYRNAYRNTLLWNVGAFFDRLFAKARLSNATLIYTSDHGQDLHERGDPGLDTHCSSTPVLEEGLVPLVVIEGRETPSLPWQTSFSANRNRVSHYEIFPTLLALMGYDPAAVRPLYGQALSDPSDDDLTFNARFNARLGKDPVWVPIELNRIAQPPASDAGAPRLASIAFKD